MSTQRVEYPRCLSAMQVFFPAIEDAASSAHETSPAEAPAEGGISTTYRPAVPRNGGAS